MISGEWIGRRPYMEDRTLILDKYDIYGVFDGHGGDKISDFMVNNFEEYYDKVLDSENKIDVGTSEKNIYRTICDLERDSKKLGLSGGSTCTIVQITKDYLLCANVGDSEAHAFMSNGSIISLSEEHSFSRFSEYYRYYDHYGEKKLYVGNTIRTRTGLMPTRTLGDFRHKRKDGALIFNPEIKKIFLNYMKWEFIVIGSDGIFDRLTPKTIVDELIKTRIMIKKQDIKDNNIFAIYDLSEKKIDRLMLRLQDITTKKSNVYDKIRNVYGGDNCSICILINTDSML
jgi:serine/threonine protein phosphatase PrpC